MRKNDTFITQLMISSYMAVETRTESLNAVVLEKMQKLIIMLHSLFCLSTKTMANLAHFNSELRARNVSGMALQNILIASHIKPWCDSDEKTERTNPSNGLCLNALHDKAFDKGLITIDKNYSVVNSKQLKDTEMDDESRVWMQSYEGQQIILPDRFYPEKQFIEYHNDVVFKD